MIKRRGFILFAICTFMVACEPVEQAPSYQYFSAEQMKTAESLKQDALAGSDTYNILEELLTVAPKRLAGSPGDLAAKGWAETKLQAFGFDRIWVQEFTMAGWKRVTASAVVTSHDNLSLDITSLGKSVSTPEGGITAEVVHFATYEDLQAADASEVEGRIVFISNKMKRTVDGSGYGPAVIARSSGHVESARKGGLAILIRSVGTDDHDAPHTGLMRFDVDGEMTVPAAAISNTDADSLQALFASGDSVTISVDIKNADLGVITSYNIIGEITGATRPDEIVITGGHIDAWDTGVGAMDDGMGVAITMNAVAMIAALPERPARTIRFVAFGAEEMGIIGAQAYADKYGEQDHVFGIESDFGIGRVRQLTPAVSLDAVPVLREIWRLMEPMDIGWNPEAQGSPGPDLSPLVKIGLVGASLDGDATRYFDLHHTAHDTLEQIDAPDLDYNTAAYAALLYLVAEYEDRFDNPVQLAGEDQG